MSIVKTIHGSYSGISYTIELYDDAYVQTPQETAQRICLAEQLAQRILWHHTQPISPQCSPQQSNHETMCPIG